MIKTMNIPVYEGQYIQFKDCMEALAHGAMVGSLERHGEDAFDVNEANIGKITVQRSPPKRRHSTLHEYYAGRKISHRIQLYTALKRRRDIAMCIIRRVIFAYLRGKRKKKEAESNRSYAPEGRHAIASTRSGGITRESNDCRTDTDTLSSIDAPPQRPDLTEGCSFDNWKWS